jgi:hypothetical protein
MAVEVFANDGQAAVTSGGTTAPSAGTVQTWTLSGSTLPAVSASATPPTQCYVCDPAAESEKILVTDISGATATVTRGADGTTPVTHSSGFTVQQVATRATFTSVSTRDAIITDTQFAGGADPTGSADSTTAIQKALLAFGTLGSTAQGQGGRVYVPPGNFKISKPLIIPQAVRLAGSGWGSQLTLITGSNCDMIQTATYNSSAQAAILGVSASGIANAFWAGIEKLWLHGDSFGTTTPGYRHGINVTTNPLTSLNNTSPADPDFDPMFRVSDLRIEACTGDGYNHSGRSGAYLERVWVAYCNGIGIVPSFDTTMIDCLSEGNMAGGYFNHTSNLGSGCKFYNNNDVSWVSGHAYTPGNVVVSANVMYFCILAVTSATAPASDATHWTALTGATAPQATGWDWYWDTGSGGHRWAPIESQEPSKGSFYFKGPNAGPIAIEAQSGNVNFNNGQPSYNAANPNHYAAVVLDGVSNVDVRLSTVSQGGGAGIVCTSLNSPGTNSLVAVTDGTEAAVFNGGTPTYALVNGALATPQVMNAGDASNPALLAQNPTATSFIPVFHAFAPNATSGQAVMFRVGQGLFGNSAEFQYVNASPRAFILSFNGGPQAVVFDDTGKVWTGAYTVPRNVLDDGSGNATLTGNLKLVAGSTSRAPQTFQSGTLLTTAAAGAAEYDGTAFYLTAQASARQVADTEQFITLTSAYTLTSQTAAQKLFNSSTNGALTVQAATAYFFECFYSLSAMSSTSGSFGFALGGTATLTSQLWQTEGNKAALATAASAQNTVNTAANTALVTATTNTVGWAKVWGKVRVNAAGTLIPQVSLGIASAAVVGVDSYFRIWPVGAATVTRVGNWS